MSRKRKRQMSKRGRGKRFRDQECDWQREKEYFMRKTTKERRVDRK